MKTLVSKDLVIHHVFMVFFVGFGANDIFVSYWALTIYQRNHLTKATLHQYLPVSSHKKMDGLTFVVLWFEKKFEIDIAWGN